VVLEYAVFFLPTHGIADLTRYGTFLLNKDEQMMNVSELIERLRVFPPDLPVLVEGYESGIEGARIHMEEMQKDVEWPRW
jgi:hypothetical protein